MSAPLTITQLASLAARREAQRLQVRRLYKKSLWHLLSWSLKPAFYNQSNELRQRFEANKHVADVDAIERLIIDGEAEFFQRQHPEPYIVPWAPGGTKWQRNTPVPPQIVIVKDFGREKHEG